MPNAVSDRSIIFAGENSYNSNSWRMNLTPEQFSVFINAIQHGSSRRAACGVAGLRESTVRRWLKRGKDIFEEGEPSPNEVAWQYYNFWRSYQQAVGGFEVAHCANINDQAVGKKGGKWAASAWMLERRRPEEFGNSQLIEKITDRKLLEFIRFAFEEGSDDFCQEFSSILQKIPNLSLTQLNADDDADLIQ